MAETTPQTKKKQCNTHAHTYTHTHNTHTLYTRSGKLLERMDNEALVPNSHQPATQPRARRPKALRGAQRPRCRRNTAKTGAAGAAGAADVAGVAGAGRGESPAGFTALPPAGFTALPKRNQLADVDVARLGLHQVGPFWISRSGKSPCYVTRVQHSILVRIAPFFTDEQLCQFASWRSEGTSDGVSLRVVDFFYTNWCKANPVLVAGADGQTITDVKEAYGAMLEKHTKLNFDPFNRGTTGILFETPAAQQDSRPASSVEDKDASYASGVLLGSQLGDGGLGDNGCSVFVSHDSLESAPSESREVLDKTPKVEAPKVPKGPDVSAQAGTDKASEPTCDVRRVNATTVGQLHFYHWLMNTQHYSLIASRYAEIHTSMRNSIRRNRQAKSAQPSCTSGPTRRKRHELSREHEVPHILSWPCLK